MLGRGLFDQDFMGQRQKQDSLLSKEEELVGLSVETLQALSGNLLLDDRLRQAPVDRSRQLINLGEPLGQNRLKGLL